jgi:hypothetical protein
MHQVTGHSHLFFLLFCLVAACFATSQKEKKSFPNAFASNVSLRGLGADEPFPRFVTRT